MDADKSSERRRRMERLARLCSQAQQRQQVAGPARPAPPRAVRAMPVFAPGWTGQSSPQAPDTATGPAAAPAQRPLR